mmetsp:Transcript_6346/g.6562  ORF Transcript_6346/g.6562 Transcript_6346/m.6562 type:complete len:298 (+) Transcript_6346:19-912(+)
MRLVFTIMADAFYSVRIGKSPGIYNSWHEAKSHVIGFPGAIFKKFRTLSDAQVFLNDKSTICNTYRSGSEFTKESPPYHDVVGVTSGNNDREGQNACFILYTDGSCLGNNNVHENICPAGWGVLVLQQIEGNGLTKVEELYGNVIIDGSQFSLGATVGSNNTGELCAIGEALLWLNDVDNSVIPAIIRYDSKYAAESVQGKYQNAKKNLDLIRNIQRIYAKTQSRREIRFEHVKGHSSDIWNQRADVLANLGRTSNCKVGRYSPDHQLRERERERERERWKERRSTSREAGAQQSIL